MPPLSAEQQLRIFAGRLASSNGHELASLNVSDFAGWRHVVAASLNNGDAPEQILARLDEGMIRQIFRCDPDGVYSHESAEDTLAVEVPTLPQSAQLDPSLGSGACPWLDKYVQFSRKWSPRAYDGFHEACGIWVLSTVAARRVAVECGKLQFTPVYIVLAARTSLYAKTTTGGIAIDVLRAAGLDWLLAADDATPQRFIADLAGRVPPGFDALLPEQQTRTENRLALPAQRGWFYEEFGQKLHAMMRQGGFMADFHGILRRFDDCPERYEYGTIGRGVDVVERPYLALLAMGRKRVVRSGSTTVSVLKMEPEVRDAFYAYHDALTDLVESSENQDLDGGYTRLAMIALRIATLFASLAGSGRVRIQHWAHAQAMAERWRLGLHALYGQANARTASKSKEIEDRILSIVTRMGGPTTVREMSQRIRNVSSVELEPIVSAMCRADLLVAVPSDKTTRYDLPERE